MFRSREQPKNKVFLRFGEGIVEETGFLTPPHFDRSILFRIAMPEI
ncbi:MAG: hypothetical protein F6J93_26605 [Oscillatoria sp. SIO1A7]|nr:hypothetical protein [Oscillatoria sp. SIO1A7]